MAPVMANATGIARQTVDDPRLSALAERLGSFDSAASTSVHDGTDRLLPVDVNGLVSELEKWPSWRFQEQADLYEWIHPLNAMDAAMSQLIDSNPKLLLIGSSRKKSRCNAGDTKVDNAFLRQAESAEEAQSVSLFVIRSLRTILRFLSNLLRNSTSKSVFNSVAELSDLLAAADDEVADLALEALSNLAAPPILHRQQAPEVSQHTTALHGPSSPSSSSSGSASAAAAAAAHRRLIALARGWGSRGSGLGLYACATADDSEGGQGGLPRHAGEVAFEFFGTAPPPSETNGKRNPNPEPVEGGQMSVSASGGGPVGLSDSGGGLNVEADASRLVRIHLSAEDIMLRPTAESSSDGSDEDSEMGSKQKRRRTGVSPASMSRKGRDTKPTSELFFKCISQAGGRDYVPPDRLFPLLADVRLARGFHSHNSRVAAVERRLRALIAVLHAHPSQDVMAGYFHAQPELSVELVDLVRPTVSSTSVAGSATVASASGPVMSTHSNDGSANRVDRVAAISSVADSHGVPYSVRTLAIEALTALVARRDGANGGLTNVARQANVLGELGVGKGQYLGLLPTLIRYSLASLNSFLAPPTAAAVTSAPNDKQASAEAEGSGVGRPSEDGAMMIDDDDGLGLGLGLGLAFLEATKAPALPRREQEERALEFIDAVLTLTSAVVSVPTGTAALTDCGLIPALVSTVALDAYAAQNAMTEQEGGNGRKDGDDSYAGCLLKFITAQAIQILEGAIVTHSNALSAFHDLRGVDVLVTRLHVEVEKVRCDGGIVSSEVEMAVDGNANANANAKPRPLQAARRVLLFSIVNCLTVVFHQQETSSSSTSSSAPSGGTQLRKPELTNALMDIMDHVDAYGGVLAALTATLLSDVMNGDPQVVHHVHSSGLARSFLTMMMGQYDDQSGRGNTLDDDVHNWQEPKLPPSSELIMVLPNVISALSLTEDGANAVLDANPFPVLLAIFCTPKYAMPMSRCLLNDMTAIVGTGLDEIMRHVSSLRPTVMRAVVLALRRVVFLGMQLMKDEESGIDEVATGSHKEQFDDRQGIGTDLENRRSYLMQYVHNFGQMLEQILHNEEHCVPFVDAGGLDALLELHPLLMPSGRQFLAHASCLSCPSVANLTHSTTSGTLSVAIKCIALHYEPQKMMKKVIDALDKQLGMLSESEKDLRYLTGKGPSGSAKSEGDGELDANGILEGVPRIALHMLDETPKHAAMVNSLSCYLRNVATMEWLTNIMSAVIRCACQRSHEMGTGWGRNEREWKKELSSGPFEGMVSRLAGLHRTALLEACRIRTEDGYEDRDLERQRPHKDWGSHGAKYRLRIVCQEGAVVRDGIEIDSCASVGGLEMGEIVDAYDRCVNSSGVMRYRTQRGWVSEQTRGHGREPIAEVLFVARAEAGVSTVAPVDRVAGKKSKRIECGIPDICSVSASVLARVQNSQTNLFACLSRVVAQGVRSLPLRSLSFQQGTIGAHVGTIVRIMSLGIQENFRLGLLQGQAIRALKPKSNEVPAKDLGLNHAGLAMYLGCMINFAHSCLYEEKRERRNLNVPVLVSLMIASGFSEGICLQDFSDDEGKTDGKKGTFPELPSVGFFGAIRYVLKHSLEDITQYALRETSNGVGNALDQPEHLKTTELQRDHHCQRVSRSVAASFPPCISFLRRLMSRTLLMDSNMSSVLSRMKCSELEALVCSTGDSKVELSNQAETGGDAYGFNPARFVRGLHCAVADVAFELWTDPRLSCAPAHIVHPIVLLAGEIFTNLEEAAKVPISPDDPGEASRGGRTGASARSALESGSGDASDLQSRLSRNISAMNAFLDGAPAAAAGSSGPTEGSEGAGEGEVQQAPPAPAPFEPSEETVTRLIEMGFSRDHALEAVEMTESNRLEVAMEFALTHPPPPQAIIDQRRAARAERRRQYQEQNAQSTEATGEASEATSDQANAPAGAAVRSASAPQPMDVDEANGVATHAAPRMTEALPPKEKPMSKEERKALRRKEEEEYAAARVKSCLHNWKEQAVGTGLIIIEGSRENIESNGQRVPLKMESQCGDGKSLSSENEATTVVISHFLLDNFLNRYPEERSKTVMEIVKRLQSHMDVGNGGARCSILPGHETEFAAICHASVIFTRALPRTRPLLLRHGIVGLLLLCVQNMIPTGNEKCSQEPSGWPLWLAPSLLLLDVMAQPTAVSLENSDGDGLNAVSEDSSKKDHPASEFDQVRLEHKKQAALLSKTAGQIFSAIRKKQSPRTPKKKKRSREDQKKSASMPIENGADGESSATEKRDEASPAETKETKADDHPIPFSNIPAYMPLISSSSADMCLSLCLRLLGHRSGCSEGEGTQKPAPPGIIHATLLLLTRLIRSHKQASQCLRMGGAELILALPAECRFSGNTGLVTVILRRLLEDEATLHTAMETEIRGTLAKLHKKQNRGPASSSESPRVNARSFVQATTPLVCREPIVFMKASATSIKFDSSATSGGNGPPSVVLLSAEERAKNVKALSDFFGSSNAANVSHPHNSNNSSSNPGNKHQGQRASNSTPNTSQKRGRSAQGSKAGSAKSSKSKSPHRSSLSRRGLSPRRSKRDKLEKSSAGSSKKFITLNGTPANHVTSLLLTEMMKLVGHENSWTEKSDITLENNTEGRFGGTSFLWTVDCLEILADLVLAVPACAAAIHRYRPPCPTESCATPSQKHPVNSLRHALSGCPSPPNTAVSFLIHNVLPQPRVALPKADNDSQPRRDGAGKSDLGNADRKKKEAYMKVKIAQTTARLLVALVARAGEGRRRVVSDLAYALSGGGLQQGSPNAVSLEMSSDTTPDFVEHEMWALQAWGELCIGLAAPRSSSVVHDNNTALSFEVVKLMLECGMANALMHGIQRVKLHHPMASSATGALLQPLEVFTRGSVFDTVQEMAEKEQESDKKKTMKANEGIKLPKKKPSSGSLARRITLGPSQRSETSFADDAMLEDGFDADTAERNVRRDARRRELNYMVDEGLVVDDDDDDDTEELEEIDQNDGSSSDSDGDPDIEVEVRLGDPDESEEESESDEDSVSGDSEESDSEESDVVDEESNVDMEEEQDHIEDEENDDDEDEDEDEEGEEGDVGWGVENDEGFFDAEEEGNAEEPAEAEGLEEGWTTIEGPSGFGGMLLGFRQGGSNEGTPLSLQNARRRGFVVDAAEAMIGNVLRGEIQMDALQEIEDTLGIRIMNHRSSADGGETEQRTAGWGRSGSGRRGVEVAGSRDLGAMGAVPAVRQSGPPDSGYSSASSVGRGGEINNMEYVYGGPSIAGGSRNYNLAAAGEEQEELDIFPVPSTVDTHLFPGGPAASAHARTQQRLHPLLCGVELPPVNSLVSALAPTTTRSGRSRGNDSMSSGGFISSSNGNILRFNRGPNGVPILEHHASRGNATGSVGGLVGWTDDGQPLDSTAGDFSLAFEQALGETMANTSDSPVADSAEESPSTENNADGTGSTGATQRDSPSATRDENVPSGPDAAVPVSSAEQEGEPAVQSISEANVAIESSLAGGNDTSSQDDAAPSNDPSSAEAPPPSNAVASAGNANAEGNTSAGEVASSLAAGLTLSPRSESSTATDPMLTAPTAADDVPASSPQDMAVDGSEQPPTQPAPGTQQTEQEEDRTEAADSNEAESPSSGQRQGPASNSVVATGQGPSNTNTNDTATDAAASATLGEGTESAAVSNEASSSDDQPSSQAQSGHEPNLHGNVCPPGMDLEVFNSLPPEMQQEVIEQNQATANVAAQLDSTSGLDPLVLAALPEDMRQEVIAQEQQERQMREETPADPSNAEEMDNACFVASLAPDLREEILLTADDTFLNSLPPNIIAEAQILRERASSQHRRIHEEAVAAASASNVGHVGGTGRSSGSQHSSRAGAAASGSDNANGAGGSASGKKRSRLGKMRVECDRSQIVFMPNAIVKETGPLMTATSMKTLVRLMYLLSPVQPPRLLHKLLQNLCANPVLRRAFLVTFGSLLNDDPNGAIVGVNMVEEEPFMDEKHSSTDTEAVSTDINVFPPPILIGTAPEVLDTEGHHSNAAMFRRRQGSHCADAIAANLPSSARGSSHDEILPPVVAKRIIDTMSYLTKSASRICLDMLINANDQLGQPAGPLFSGLTCLDRLFDLLGKPLYSKSSTNLEQLLSLVESAVAPLSLLPKDSDGDIEMNQKETDNAAADGKEWAEVPRAVVSQHRLHLLIDCLRQESCKDSSFQKVNTITRRLCRVEENRTCILSELASVAQGLGVDAIRDLRSLSIRLDDAVKLHRDRMQSAHPSSRISAKEGNASLLGGIPSSAVTLSTSSSELKLLRVLQTLHALCGETAHDESGAKKTDGSVVVTQELVALLQSINLEALWDQLTSCLRVVSVLEGVANFDDKDETKDENGDNGSVSDQEEESETNITGGKKLQNSVAGLLTRFLPTIEAFFVVNASSTGESPVGEKRAIQEERANQARSAPPTSPPPSAHIEQAVSASKLKLQADADLDLLVGGTRLVKFVAANKVLLNALLRNNPSLLDKGLRAMVQVRQCRPFLDFDVKRQWFKTQVRRLRQHASRRHGSLRLNIRRENVFEDAYNQLRPRNADEMRGRVHITFRNEEGVDAGGLSREFFGILAKEMFNPNYALFTSTEDGCTFQPNPNSSINPDHLLYFRFVGRIVGKAVADGYLLDAHFTRSLYKHMLGVKPTHHDMEAIDPDYYKNLKMILEYNLVDIGLDLTFSTEDHSFGRSHIIDLIPHGRTVAVTEETKGQYVDLVCQHRMTTAIEDQIKAYLDGFYELVKPELISVFNAKELELLISGMPEIDVDDLKRNTDYQGYKATDKEIGWFWSIMFTLSRSEKAAFLQFVTGSSKVPLAGFSELQGMRGIQKFSIHKAGGSTGALMSAHTCFNSLDLPVYNNEEEMREKLLYAISEGGGGFLFA